MNEGAPGRRDAGLAREVCDVPNPRRELTVASDLSLVWIWQDRVIGRPRRVGHNFHYILDYFGRAPYFLLFVHLSHLTENFSAEPLTENKVQLPDRALSGPSGQASLDQ